MSYENAPATKLLATHCAACGRPLVDAKSVETGLGPDCRKRLGFEAAVSDEARKAANKLVYQAAMDQGNSLAFLQAADALRVLGFDKLAARLIERGAPVRIEVRGDELLIITPYADGVATDDWRRVRGRRWDKEAKANAVPASQRVAAYGVLLRHFEGALGFGPKGPFVVGAPAKPAADEADDEAELEQARRDEARKASIDGLVAKGCPLAEAERIVANVEAGRCPDGCCGGPEEHERDADMAVDAHLEAVELFEGRL